LALGCELIPADNGEVFSRSQRLYRNGGKQPAWSGRNDPFISKEATSLASDVATQIPPDAQWLILYAPAHCENSKREKSKKG
jgi:hypothetical protein